MDTTTLKKFAQGARRQLIEQVFGADGAGFARGQRGGAGKSEGGGATQGGDRDAWEEGGGG